MAKGDWNAVSKAHPCPICHKPDNCKISQDMRAVYCGRVPSNNSQNKGGQWLHFLDRSQIGSHPILDGEPVPLRKTETKQPKDWQANSDYFVKLGTELLTQLAEEFKVSVQVLQRLQVGVTYYAHKHLKWTFPERDAEGKIIGINCRDAATGVKRMMAGGNRGLTYALNWDRTPGPIYLPEGASDTAILMEMGFCAIGRPNDKDGVDLVAELLRPHVDRQIVVQGDNDLKSDGLWPGRTGATDGARKIANQLRRSVFWALPPAGYKDAREYHLAPQPKPPWELELHEVQPDSFEEFVPETGDIKSLEEFRAEISDARLKALEEPGIYFDSSPTGAGKSFADRCAMAKAGTSLILVPTHKVGDELATELKEDGFEADKLPVRCDPETYQKHWAEREKNPRMLEFFAGVCTNMTEVKDAETLGLSVGAVVCSTCPGRDGCDYLEKHKLALAAPHLVTTHAMFATSPDTISGNRAYIAIHEDPNDMLRPLIKATRTDLEWILKVAAEGSHLRKWFRYKLVDLAEVDFFDAVYDTTKDLLALLDSAESTQVFESDKPVWPIKQRQIFQSCESLLDRSLLENSEISSNGMKLILGLLSGKIKYLAIRVTQSNLQEGTGELNKELVGVFQTHLPEDRTIVISDATHSAEGLEELIGRPVKDVTPQGRLERKTALLQIPIDIKRSTRFSKIIKLLAGILARFPQARRVGVIGLPPHIKKLREHLGKSSLRQRIHKTCYFGEGPDRASNEWHTHCDLLVVLGTPRVPPEAVIDQLIRRGRLKEALEEGQWGKRLWEAESPTGQRHIIEGLGYANISWRRAHEELVPAPMRQAIGRARSFQDDGIPAIVCSNEPLNLPVEEVSQISIKLSKRAQQAWEWLQGEIAKSVSNNIYTFGKFKTREASLHLQMSLPQTSKALSELIALGYVTKPSYGNWEVTELAQGCIAVDVKSLDQ